MSEPIDLRALFLDNPELRRNLQIELSPKRVFTAGLITALYALIVLPSLLSTGRSYPQAGVSQYLMVLLWSQKITLSVGGAISCWRAVRRERELNTFDFQRITRLSPLELAIGKLFGAPALSYFVTLCLALAAIFSAVTTSSAAVSLLWHSYVLLFTSALVLHTFALMISTVSDKGGAVGGVLILLLLQLFPLIGWISILQNTGIRGPEFAFAGPLRFYGIPFPSTMLWATLELGFAAFLLAAVVRNIKRELEAIQLFSLRQGIGFALYCNFVWIGFYSWGGTAPGAGLALLLLWCVLIFYVIGIGVLPTRDLVRREIREISPVSAAPTRLLMPILAILAAAFLTALFVVLFGQQRSLEAAATSNVKNNSYFLLFYFIAWCARDLLYLQWMNVRPVRSPIRKAFLYLGVFYISTSIIFRTAMVSSAADAAAFSAWLAPFAALRTWDSSQWGSASGAWFVALLVQAASAAGFAYLYRQQILALAPQPYATPPAAPRLSSKPA